MSTLLGVSGCSVVVWFLCGFPTCVLHTSMIWMSTYRMYSVLDMTIMLQLDLNQSGLSHV